MPKIRLRLEYTGRVWDNTPEEEIREDNWHRKKGWVLRENGRWIQDRNGQGYLNHLVEMLRGFMANESHDGIRHAWWRLVLIVDDDGEYIRTADGDSICLRPGRERKLVLAGPWRQGEDLDKFEDWFTQDENGDWHLPFNLPKEFTGPLEALNAREGVQQMTESGETYWPHRPGELVEEEKDTTTVRSTVRNPDGSIEETETFESISPAVLELAPGTELVVEGPDGNTFTFEVLG